MDVQCFIHNSEIQKSVKRQRFSLIHVVAKLRKYSFVLIRNTNAFVYGVLSHTPLKVLCNIQCKTYYL